MSEITIQPRLTLSDAELLVEVIETVLDGPKTDVTDKSWDRLYVLLERFFTSIELAKARQEIKRIKAVHPSFRKDDLE